MLDNIKRLKESGTNRGRRHALGLPVRGQRTRTQVCAFISFYGSYFAVIYGGLLILVCFWYRSKRLSSSIGWRGDFEYYTLRVILGDSLRFVVKWRGLAFVFRSLLYEFEYVYYVLYQYATHD